MGIEKYASLAVLGLTAALFTYAIVSTEKIAGNDQRNYFLLTVMPGQVSVLKGDAGNPSALYRLQNGLLAQA